MHADPVVDGLRRLADWFANATLNISACSAEDACHLLLCAKDLGITSHGLQRRLSSLCSEEDPPEQQRRHIVLSLLRQVVLMRYDVSQDEREEFFRYWLDGDAFRKESPVTISYIVGLALEQPERVSPHLRAYVRKWHARHDELTSLRVRAWEPRYLQLAGYHEEARTRALRLLAERERNGGWPGGVQLSTTILYALAVSEVVSVAELDATISHATRRLGRGLTGTMSLETTTLKSLQRLSLLPTDLHAGIQRRLASEMSVFLSHASHDKPFARRLCLDLERLGCRVWFDEAELKPGDSFVDRIETGIDDMHYLVIVLSPEAVASSWVKRELNMALLDSLESRQATVIPILLRDCAIPGLLRERQYADFRSDYESGLAQLRRVFEVPRRTPMATRRRNS